MYDYNPRTREVKQEIRSLRSFSALVSLRLYLDMWDLSQNTNIKNKRHEASEFCFCICFVCFGKVPFFIDGNFQKPVELIGSWSLITHSRGSLLCNSNHIAPAPWFLLPRRLSSCLQVTLLCVANRESLYIFYCQCRQPVGWVCSYISWLLGKDEDSYGPGKRSGTEHGEKPILSSLRGKDNPHLPWGEKKNPIIPKKH